MSGREAAHRHGKMCAALRRLVLWVLLAAGGDALDLIHGDARELTCSQGLAHCHISSGSLFSEALPDPAGPLDVAELRLKVVLCCPEENDCMPCLRVAVSLRDMNAGEDCSGESGSDADEDNLKQTPVGSVNLCLSSPATIGLCKALQFESRLSTPGPAPPQSAPELLLTERVNFESLVVVSAYSKGATIVQNITVPSLLEVCSMTLRGSIKKCDAPRLRVVDDDRRNVALLQLEKSDVRQDEVLWQMMWNERAGEVLAWPRGTDQVVVPADVIVPCLCFKVWWAGSDLQRKYCPFDKRRDALQRMWHNVTVSLKESHMRGRGTGLTWNVTAPCRLDAEVWLCKKDAAGRHCDEVKGSRQKLQSNWRVMHRGQWQVGEFNVSSQPLFCVQTHIKGMESYLEPNCPFTTSHSRWGLVLLIGLLLMSVAVLGAYFIQGIVRGYVWRWLKEEDVKGAVGGGHVLLLYSRDDDGRLPGLLCHLGSSLQALGFSVSLDLWSQAELAMLGPVPWLHSRLDRLQKHGGKVVLVLTQSTWTRAEEWGAQGWERCLAWGKNMKEEEEEGRGRTTSSPYSDVFSASLSCILADYLQGRAGERFMLVQFESLPPEPPGSFRPLPQLFRGLHVYSLPSQSLGFLTELSGAHKMATASARRKRAGGLRMASRTLAKRLSVFSTGTSVLRLAGVSQRCVGARVEDSGETVHLQTCLITPPCSPHTDHRGNEVDWV